MDVASLLVGVYAGSNFIAQQRPPQRLLVLDGERLIDGTGKAPVANAVIVVDRTGHQGGWRQGQVTFPADANVIRLDGRMILPGLR